MRRWIESFGFTVRGRDGLLEVYGVDVADAPLTQAENCRQELRFWMPGIKTQKL